MVSLEDLLGFSIACIYVQKNYFTSIKKEEYHLYKNAGGFILVMLY
jgi:hypothetical protein